MQINPHCCQGAYQNYSETNSESRLKYTMLAIFFLVLFFSKSDFIFKSSVMVFSAFYSLCNVSIAVI